MSEYPIEQCQRSTKENKSYIPDVDQNLTAEQYRYEFPSKQTLLELAYLDDERGYSFFDESSFTNSSYTAIETDQYNDNHHMVYYEDEGSVYDESLVDDGMVSPLYLPIQTSSRRESLETSSVQSSKAVGPAYFLSDIHKHHMHQTVTPTRTTSYMRQGRSIISRAGFSDSANSTSTLKMNAPSHTVLIKLSKHQSSAMTFVKRCSTSLTYIASDEGYNDDDDYMSDGQEMESHCTFLPLSDDEEDYEQDNDYYRQDQAAVKIQSLWRGYRSRRENKQTFSQFRPEQRVFLNLANLCSRLHRRQMNAVDERLNQLEQRLCEETAMRKAFEKAVHDMTEIIDEQQENIHERISQEVDKRQTEIDTLKARLQKEANARHRMEDMMTSILDRMKDAEITREEQAKKDAESRKIMQAKLDLALEEIAIVKRNQAPKSTRTAAAAAATTAVSAAKPSSKKLTTAVRRQVLKSSSPSTIASSPKLPSASKPSLSSITVSSSLSSESLGSYRRFSRPTTSRKAEDMVRPSAVPYVRSDLQSARSSNASTAKTTTKSTKTTKSTRQTNTPLVNRRNFLSQK
ncbi:hypothetical protein [Parasitella parasitica]|uniref:Uncharacterized protein n=1 Tax=Parasitella parasitica TaxID=35722 RepID=A0A0B7N7Z8_9FUNG|nr:hypothetical protein [Parasitella parasitica]